MVLVQALTLCGSHSACVWLGTELGKKPCHGIRAFPPVRGVRILLVGSCYWPFSTETVKNLAYRSLWPDTDLTCPQNFTAFSSKGNESAYANQAGSIEEHASTVPVFIITCVCSRYNALSDWLILRCPWADKHAKPRNKLLIVLERSVFTGKSVLVWDLPLRPHSQFIISSYEESASFALIPIMIFTTYTLPCACLRCFVFYPDMGGWGGEVRVPLLNPQLKSNILSENK